jgi:hypothetical protein
MVGHPVGVRSRNVVAANHAGAHGYSRPFDIEVAQLTHSGASWCSRRQRIGMTHEHGIPGATGAAAATGMARRRQLAILLDGKAIRPLTMGSPSRWSLVVGLIAVRAVAGW